MNKKNLFIIIETLNCAGAERSLVTLLSLIDYSKFNIDLQLIQYGGKLQKLLPKEVNLLPPLSITSTLNQNFKEFIIHSLTHLDFKRLYARIKYSYLLRKLKPGGITISRLFWDSYKSFFDKQEKEYDIAIGYSQGIPTFYAVEKVKAKKKIAWVNVTHNLQGLEKEFQYNYYKKLDSIVCVSDTTKKLFANTFPDIESKMKIIWDILSYDVISKQAKLTTTPFTDNFIGPRIITVARLSGGQKGMDITLDVCRILRDKGIEFKWYILGEGGFRKEMENYISKHNLQNYLYLLGVRTNPYPYIKNSTIYVQTSRIEGFGLSIAEARILNIPVVTTEFDAVYMQMVPNKNGLVVAINANAVADAIERLLKDKELYDSIVAYQKQEKKGNTEEIEKFYQLID